MVNNKPFQGPGQGVLSIIQRIARLLIHTVETRVSLVTLELEEERAHIFRLLIVAGITLLLFAFGLMTLIGLLCLVVPPEYRLMVLSITSALLFFFALIGGLWTIKKARNTPFLGETRKQLQIDRAILKDK